MISMTQHNDDDTTQYIAHESPRSPESTLNQDVERLTLWFTANYLQINTTKYYSGNETGEISVLIQYFYW